MLVKTVEEKEVGEVRKPTTVDRLRSLGFSRAAEVAVNAKVRAKKLMVAYEFYRFVRQEKIDAFSSKLYRDSRNDEEGYKILSFVSIENYDKFPPESVLDSLEVAKNRNCFDEFEVAFIARVKDPILFGRINGCTDRFYIDQWDDDVKIQDIIKDNEG